MRRTLEINTIRKTILLFSDESINNKKFSKCLKLLENSIEDFGFNTVFVTNINKNLKHLEKYAIINDYSLIIEKPSKKLLSAGWFYSTPNMFDKYLKDTDGFVCYFFDGDIDRLIYLSGLTKSRNKQFICISAENEIFRMSSEDIDLTIEYGFRRTYKKEELCGLSMK